MPSSMKNRMPSLNAFAGAKLAALEEKNQRRYLYPTARSGEMHLRVSGDAPLISFSDNDYLGLSTHPDIIAASMAATKAYGAGSGASRLVTGNCPLNGEVEATIARIKGTEDAVVFGSGYLANVGIIPTFIRPNDLILADELVHTSIHSGIALTQAKVLFFRHNDVAHAEALLKEHRGHHPHTLIIVDGVYSMDGDIAPLKELGQLAETHDAWLMNDDAHALGTIGGGRGSAHACGAEHMVPLQMGTLSKAVGAYGGYLAASKPVIDLIKTRARSFIYTTGLPPGTLGAALKALEMIETDRALTERPLLLAKRFTTALNLPAPETPIVPLVIGTEIDTLAASAALAEKGFKATAFRPPTVAEGTSRLRFTFSASHKDADIDRLIGTCRDLGLGGAVA